MVAHYHDLPPEIIREILSFINHPDLRLVLRDYQPTIAKASGRLTQSFVDKMPSLQDIVLHPGHSVMYVPPNITSVYYLRTSNVIKRANNSGVEFGHPKEVAFHHPTTRVYHRENVDADEFANVCAHLCSVLVVAMIIFVVISIIIAAFGAVIIGLCFASPAQSCWGNDTSAGKIITLITFCLFGAIGIVTTIMVCLSLQALIFCILGVFRVGKLMDRMKVRAMYSV